MSKNKLEKTNALRIVEQAGLVFEVLTYEVDENAVDGISVAAKINCPPESVYKTLLTQGQDKAYYVFVIPVMENLDLKLAATKVGVKKLEMIPVNDLLKVTGYIRGGCSPVGMKKKYRTIFDEGCLLLDKIIVSAGKRGMQLKMDPQALIDLVDGIIEDVIKH